MKREMTDAQKADLSGGGCPMSRRGFLGAAGVGAGALLVPGGAAAKGGGGGGGDAPSVVGGGGSNRFSLMFDLPPFAEGDSDQLKAALGEIGKRGGMNDANDPLSSPRRTGPQQAEWLTTHAGSKGDNPTQPAGIMFLGQFLDHDITLDTSELGKKTSFSLRNGRTAAFDLDSVYGSGPTGSQELYSDRSHLKIGTGRAPYEDVPRHADNSAIIPDGRNDENAGIDGLQAAFLKFHNKVVDDVVPKSITGADARFREAKKIVTWHYQWMIVHYFLPKICGKAMTEIVFAPGGRKFYINDIGDMPVEFQTACYRYGHATVRPSYLMNSTGGAGGGPRYAFIFDKQDADRLSHLDGDPDDMSGGFPGAKRVIGWDGFFPVRRNGGLTDTHLNAKLINLKLASPLLELPLGVIRAGGGPNSLPHRTLLRGITWQVPSGQAVANAMGRFARPLPDGMFDDLKPIDQAFGTNLANSTPLWTYMLAEADFQNGGQFLGDVGGRIVAEVFAGLLQNDPASYLNAAPSGWTPNLGLGRVDGDFDITDLLHVADVDGVR